jgi:hypothetical protein
VTWAGSLVITAAAINTTHKMTPTAFRNIKALINRCPMGESIHDCDDHGNAAYHARSGPKGVIRFGFAIGCGRELEAVLLVVTNG